MSEFANNKLNICMTSGYGKQELIVKLPNRVEILKRPKKKDTSRKIKSTWEFFSPLIFSLYFFSIHPIQLFFLF